MDVSSAFSVLVFLACDSIACIKGDSVRSGGSFHAEGGDTVLCRMDNPDSAKIQCVNIIEHLGLDFWKCSLMRGKSHHAPQKPCFGGYIAEGNLKGAQACARQRRGVGLYSTVVICGDYVV